MDSTRWPALATWWQGWTPLLWGPLPRDIPRRMEYAVTLIPGDGIGPEVTEAAVRVIDAACPRIRWERVTAGAIALETCGDPLPQAVIDSVKRNRIALKGR